MKRLSVCLRPTRYSGFTLVELLVVIAIIAILAGVLLSAGGLVIRMAKKAKAANMATQIQTSVLNYYTEYSVYPVPAGATDYLLGDTDAANWKVMLCALCGNISPLDGSPVAATTITNSRGIAFLNLQKSDVFDSANPANVAPMNPLPTGTSKYFNLAIDADYDGVIGSTASAVKMPNFGGTFSATTGGTSTAGAAVWANCNGNNATTSPNWYVHTY